MNSEYFSAFAALAGSLIGGLTMLASSWLSQKAQARAEQLAHHRSRREELYADFIEESAQLYADALEHEKAEFVKFVKLYALISRMQVLSSPKIVEIAERVAHTILETYRGPKKNVPRARRFGEERRGSSPAGIQRSVPQRIADAWSAIVGERVPEASYKMAASDGLYRGRCCGRIYMVPPATGGNPHGLRV